MHTWCKHDINVYILCVKIYINVWLVKWPPLVLVLVFLHLRHAHQHQRDPEGEEPEAVSPQPALPCPESDPSDQPQPLPVCASEPGAQTRSRGSESEHQHLLQPPPPTDRSVCWEELTVFLNPLVDKMLQPWESGCISLHHWCMLILKCVMNQLCVQLSCGRFFFMMCLSSFSTLLTRKPFTANPRHVCDAND